MKLEVIKFGPITNSVFDLKDINLFIGESSTGKSIITKLIYICNSFVDNFSFASQKKIPSAEDIENRLMKAFEKMFFDVFKGSYHEFDFKYHFEESKYLQYSKQKGKAKLFFSDMLDYSVYTAINESLLVFNKFEKLFDEDTKNTEIISLSIINQLIKDELKTENYIYIPAARSFVTLMSDNFFTIAESGAQIDQILAKFGRLFVQEKKDHTKGQSILVQAPEYIKEKTHELLKGHYYYEDEEDRLYISDNNYLPVSQISSGQQELLPALLVLVHILNTKRPVSVIFEEPEAHLFPKDQQRLIELIIYILNIKKGNNKLFITTHSPYVLSVLNNLIYAGTLKSTLIDENLHVDFDKVAAFALSKEEPKNILNNDNKLIDANYIDEVSNEIAEMFGSLLDEEYGDKEI